jgi:hypothetical protein
MSTNIFCSARLPKSKFLQVWGLKLNFSIQNVSKNLDFENLVEHKIFVFIKGNFLLYYISKIRQKAKLGTTNFSIRVFQLRKKKLKKNQCKLIKSIFFMS